MALREATDQKGHSIKPTSETLPLGSVSMELAAGPPAHWVVTLADGFQVDVWADAVTGLTEKTAHQEHVVFGVLMDIDVDRLPLA